ncbi:MAG: ABC transporter ATP-binding protein [Gemmatimonadales bacterium]|nr:ABC transporter ATP-binding protein [Gemmatimonadales bacterium]
MISLGTGNLRFSWPAQERWALDGITLQFAPGELTWLHGSLGAGTSTLLLALAGLAPRITGGTREGEVLLSRVDPADSTPLDLGVGYLGPSPTLQLSGIARTVQDEIAVGPMNLGWPRQRILAAVADAMQRVGISALADRAPDLLSGGETQRVLLAALLAAEPQLLLLDEPFSALDRAGREQVSALLRELADSGLMVVVACDDADTMSLSADRLVVLKDGRVALDGPPAELLAGDALRRTGASATDAATLAALAGWDEPRPLTAAAVLAECRPAPEPLQPEFRSGKDESPADSETTTLSFSGVTFGYPGQPAVLRDLSLTLAQSRSYALLGANGAGKSTLLRLAMALEHPSAGTIHTIGRPTVGLGPEDLAPTVGFLFQQPERQLFASSVRAEAALAPTLAGWDQQRIAEAVAAVLEQLSLSALADEHPWDLPLPLRRLVALASVLVTSPKLLLLDEPTAALDGRSRDLVIAGIRLAVENGATVLAVTHDAIFAHEALDRAILVEAGTTLESGPLADTLESAGLSPTASMTVARELRVSDWISRRREVATMLSGIRHQRY